MMNIFEKGLRGIPLSDCFVVDVHAHLGPRSEIDRDCSPARWLERMDAIGIDVTCAMSFTPTGGATVTRHNDYVYQFIANCPCRIKGYCWVNPNYPDVMMSELRRCFDDLEFLGIKMHYHPRHPYDGERYAPMYHFADSRGLPILAHTWGDDWLKQFADMARKYPQAVFISAHTGGGDMNISIEEAKRTPNLYLDVALSMGTPYQVERLVKEVGPEKLLWGSDTQLFSPAHQIGKVIFADIPEADKRLILGENAKRVLRLGGDC